MAEIGWGRLNDVEIFGRIQNKEKDFEPITYEGVECAYPTPEYQHAAHCMIYCKDETVLWDLYERRAKVLMQLRFDGVIGFPGGLVDPGEGPVEAVNRELLEEAGITDDRYQMQASNHMISHYHKPKKLVLHFYAKEVSPGDYQAIEKGVMQADEYAVETLGIIQVPLYTMGDGIRGLPAFLSNRFSGNARQQLLCALERCNILSEEEIDKALTSLVSFGPSTERDPWPPDYFP